MAKKDENEKTQQGQKEDGSMRNEGLPLANDVHLQNPNNAPLLADQQEAQAPGQAHQGAPDPLTEGKKQRSRLNAVKHGAMLDKSIDRTLSQLERLQRMRLGQPVPPPVKVELSS